MGLGHIPRKVPRRENDGPRKAPGLDDQTSAAGPKALNSPWSHRRAEVASECHAALYHPGICAGGQSGSPSRSFCHHGRRRLAKPFKLRSGSRRPCRTRVTLWPAEDNPSPPAITRRVGFELTPIPQAARPDRIKCYCGAFGDLAVPGTSCPDYCKGPAKAHTRPGVERRQREAGSALRAGRGAQGLRRARARQTRTRLDRSVASVTGRRVTAP